MSHQNKGTLFEILIRKKGGVDSWLSSGLENRRPFTRVAGSNPVTSATLPKGVIHESKKQRRRRRPEFRRNCGNRWLGIKYYYPLSYMGITLVFDTKKSVSSTLRGTIIKLKYTFKYFTI